MLLHFLAQLHSNCPGPLSTEATEGSSQVVARTAAQFALQALQPTGASPCAEVSSLSAAITAAAGGSSDNTVEVDSVLELLEGAWAAQRSVEQQQLERILAQTDARGKGITNQEEFAGLVKHVGVGSVSSMAYGMTASCRMGDLIVSFAAQQCELVKTRLAVTTAKTALVNVGDKDRI